MSRTSATDNIDPRRQAIATRMFREHSQSARLIYGLVEEVPVDNKLGQRFDATSRAGLPGRSTQAARNR